MHLQAGTPVLQTLFLYPLPENVTLNGHCLDFSPPRNGSASALSVSGRLGDLYNSVFNMTIRLLPLEQKEVTHAIPDSAPENVLSPLLQALAPWRCSSRGLRGISINGLRVELQWTANKPGVRG